MNLEREIEDILKALFEAIIEILKFLGRLFLGVFKGVRRIRTLRQLLFFLCSMGVASAAAWKWKSLSHLMAKQLGIPEQWGAIPVICLILMPFVALMISGMSAEHKQKKYKKAFGAVAFKSKNGNYPYLIDVKAETKNKKFRKKNNKRKEIYLFKSMIPMQEWVARKQTVELALNCNVLRFAEGGSKNITKVITVPAECVIPDMLQWGDSKLSDIEGEMVLGEGAIEIISFNLNKTPHALIAGETGSGKSVILRELLWQMILKGSKVYMFDFKGGVEFGKAYERFGEVVTELDRALQILTELCEENEARLKLLRETEAKNLTDYNKKMHASLCRVGVFCDEIAEMLDKTGAGKERKASIEAIEGKLSTLARLSRATGINLFLGVQRPDAKIITGQIKNNVPVRICGRFADRAASEIVLGNSDAVYLPDVKGRFLFRMGNEIAEFQAYYFDDDIHLGKPVEKRPGDMLIHNRQRGPEDQGPTDSESYEPVINMVKHKVEPACVPESYDPEGDFHFDWSCEGENQDV